MHRSTYSESCGVQSGPADQALPKTANYKFDKVVIAVHGIGQQRHGDTNRAVSRRFGDLEEPPLPVQPLGYFDVESEGQVRISELHGASKYKKIGLAEMFWADIPRDVVSKRDKLEEIKVWGHTVASRARETYEIARSNAPEEVAELSAADFELGVHVLDEIVETLGVLENLLYVLDKMGVFKFEVGPLLRDYLGDVQVVAEFKRYRDTILARFHDTMNKIVAEFGESPCEIYIVAHSEGSVISFLALLQALSGVSIVAPGAPPQELSTAWVKHVRGFMTIGSPIDKHLVLWPKLWEGLRLQSTLRGTSVIFESEELAIPRSIPARIRWRNYYDHGDPIGFKLDAARRFLKNQGCVAFEFRDDGENHDDIGFSRYYFPGKAHVDYWTDADVFGHFIHEVVSPPQADVGTAARTTVAAAKPIIPATKNCARVVAYVIPYALILLIHLAAVFAVLKGITAFVAPNGWGLASPRHLALKVAVLGLLLTGATVAARLPRLVKVNGFRFRHLRWYPLALLVFMAAATPMLLSLPFALCVAHPESLLDALALPPIGGRILNLVGLAAVVTLSGWVAPKQPHWGSRMLVGLGTALVTALVVWRLWGTPQGVDECSGTVASVESSALASHDQQDPPIWPLLLSGAAFVYLWRLGVLLFDLTFVWQRYIRNEAGVDALRSWHHHRPAPTEVTRGGGESQHGHEEGGGRLGVSG